MNIEKGWQLLMVSTPIVLLIWNVNIQTDITLVPSLERNLKLINNQPEL